MVDRNIADLKVLHVNDCAFTVENLMRVARQRGLPWQYLPLATYETGWESARDRVRRAGLGAVWLARLARQTMRTDLRHVHSATVVQHSQLVPQRYVLHVHGSDVRTLQYDDNYGPIIRRGLRRAEAVCYSTPDLAEHTLSHRPDARYVPVPIDVDGMPSWEPTAPPIVFFSSRWDGSKGLGTQLELAQRLVAALGATAQVVGLDWGEGAKSAQTAGVRVVPRRDHAAFIGLLRRASVVVGQSSGILAASELEALAVGVPLVMGARRELYPEAPPVLQLGPHLIEEAVAAVVEALTNGPAFAGDQSGRSWVRAHHAAALQVDRLLDLYAGLC